MGGLVTLADRLSLKRRVRVLIDTDIGIGYREASRIDHVGM